MYIYNKYLVQANSNLHGTYRGFLPDENPVMSIVSPAADLLVLLFSDLNSPDSYYAKGVMFDIMLIKSKFHPSLSDPLYPPP